jgi:hypothetical protein
MGKSSGSLHLRFDVAPVQDNGGGRLITSEFEPSKVARARANLTSGGLIDLVEIRDGDALEKLSADLPDTVDLLLLEGAKALYAEILSLGASPRSRRFRRRRQRRLQPRVPGACAGACERLSLDTVRGGGRVVDESGLR